MYKCFACNKDINNKYVVITCYLSLLDTVYFCISCFNSDASQDLVNYFNKREDDAMRSLRDKGINV